MILNTGKAEFTLDFSTYSYMTLRGELKCDNLRKALLQACGREDYEAFARGLKVFSGGKLAALKDAYACIDRYCEENSVRRPDMFMQFIVQLGEQGFFGDVKTLEEVRQMVESPELEIDMDELTGEVVKMFKGQMLEQVVIEMAQNISTTGAHTSTAFGQPLTAAV